MQATLMNFGDNTRVVYDIHNKPCVIDIGQVVETDIADVHFHMIKRAIATDTLMIVPKEARMSPKLVAILDILKSIETEPYEIVLQKFNEVAAEVRAQDEVPVQPPRHAIRHMLRDLAKYEVAKTLGMSSKIVIREQGDETTRDDGQLRPAAGDQRAPGDLALNDPPAAKPAKKAAARSSAGQSKPAKTVPKTKVTRERL